jgi:hypothetical protein
MKQKIIQEMSAAAMHFAKHGPKSFVTHVVGKDV